MAQYFTERLQKVFHMIFTSYNQKMAQEGLRQLELIVNNQQNPSQLKDRALRNDKTSRLESDIDTKEDALKIANDSEARELGDAYALDVYKRQLNNTTNRTVKECMYSIVEQIERC